MKAPYSQTLEKVLMGEMKAVHRSKITMRKDADSLIITIDAADIASLRASTNTILQAISVHDSA